MGKVCAIKNCDSGRKQSKKKKNMPLLSFFQATEASKRLENWTKCLGINLKNSDYICQLHFKEEDIKSFDKIIINGKCNIVPLTKKKLIEGALPTLEHHIHTFNFDTSQQHAITTNIYSPEEQIIIYNNGEYQQQEIECTENEMQQVLVEQLNDHDPLDIQEINLNDWNVSALPEFWSFSKNPRGFEFMRVDLTTRQIKYHIRVNQDLSITVICSNNREITLDKKITSVDDIYSYLKSVEKWPVCVGTLIDSKKYSENCTEVVIGDDSYKRMQMNPRCKSCRYLRNQLQTRKNVVNNLLEKSIACKIRARNQKKKYKRLNTTMPYGKTVCSVNNCLNFKGKPKLRFPSPTKHSDLFQQWLISINNPDLLKMSPLHIYKYCRICTRHFEDKWINSVTGRKIPGAVPTIFYTREEEINHLKLKPSETLTKDLIESTSDDNIQPSSETLNTVLDQFSNISKELQHVSCNTKETQFVPCSTKESLVVFSSTRQNKTVDSIIKPQKTSVINKGSKLSRIANVKSKSDCLYQYIKILEKKNVAKNKIDKYCYNIFKKAANQGHLYNLYKILHSNLNKNAESFLLSQIKKSEGYRKQFTLDEKILAVSIFQSLQGLYKYMTKYFSVPNINSMKELLKNVPYAPGVNINLQIHAERVLQNINVEHRTCVLMFTKIPILPHLTFDVKEDQIWGFENMGMIQRPAFAEYAIIFLLRGLSSNRWKLPYAFMFLEKNYKTSDLVYCISTVLKAAFLANFNVVATISDQSRQNKAAIKYLKQQTRMLCISEGRILHTECYEFEGNKIVHLYNPIHLLKEFRDKFLSNDIAFTMDNMDYEASWSDIEKVYKYDRQLPILQCPELLEQCVILDKIRKMDLSLPAKALSRSVHSAITTILAEMFTEEAGQFSHGLKQSANGTAKIILFIDELYDSINGTRAKDLYVRPLREIITSNSVHWVFWEKAKIIMQSMKLINKTNNTNKEHFLHDWFVTLSSIEYLCKMLTKFGISSLDARILNLDPLDDLIDNIKLPNSQQKLTVYSFITSFRSLSINNFNTSLKTDIINDDDVSIVDIKSLLKRSVEEINLESSNSQIIILKSEEKRTRWAVPTTIYVGKYVACKILQLTDIHTCKACIRQLLSTEIITPLTLNNLLKSKTRFMHYVKRTIDIIYCLLPQISHYKQVTQTLVQYVTDNINFRVLTCEIHNISNTFSEFIVQFCIFNWIKRTNRYLNGSSKRPKFKLDPIHLLAVQHYKNSLRKCNRY